MRIVDALNTHNPALIVLFDMGFEVGLSPSEDGDDDLGLWYAKKKDVVLEAGDPLALLGLATIWQSRGEEWRRPTDRDEYDRILSEAYPDD